MSQLRLVTDATDEPVTLDELKLHLRIDSTNLAEDDMLLGMLKGARKLAENKTRRALMPQTWKLFMDDFSTEIVLPRAPLSTSSGDVVITYFDAVSGDSTTLSSTYYTVDSDSEPGRVRLNYQSDYPAVYPVPNAVQISFKAGYPLTTASEETCPEEIKTWIKMRVAGLYETRESHGDRGLQELPHSFLDGLLDPYVLIEVGP